ncbi:hypothetical protein A3I34_02965 [Candidatus Jorgensenbacteria bacterium RIFCSPLOWO2_02_FULL_45_12]|uniref:Uncharacterized protein n=2 Tax=Candidatus Joergenseniibacteriota TaxID=1752739 RepID=A0A1F6BMW5_9BACT|nr:MAG: hypothetical protein UX22_C0008G0002 [Candidatus Jorgensenbacteria bacterium GW2011_GWA2_45_9]OGG38266.1 MAG: hypothetical protein A3D55_01375 [Candidatus Jorgensenbacteria bacterium RIFCSPHIGHO2_02_FULL_45_20]OGG42308.1 MAG: hypothetical protein A3I34_02965 [Candidatus Jorgensenbacteria bacterium RIFCSPLOWO2_02_FULL_45_12]
MENKGAYFAILILTLFVLGGFFATWSYISSLRTDVKNMELSFEFQKQNTGGIASSTDKITVAEQADKESPSGSQNPAEKEDAGIKIPTGVIFSELSSVALLPQTQLKVTIDSVIRYKDGQITVNFKAFTDTASSYAAFEPKYVFGLINPENGDEQKAFKLDGKFDSIPPKSASSGTLTFQGFPERQTIILQIGSGEDIKFYEFNFTDKTYKKTEIG